MKNRCETKLVPLGVFALAVSANVLRRGYYACGMEANGLLVRSHPMAVAMWVCVAAAAALIVYGAFREGSRKNFADVFRASPLSGVGQILAGWCLGWTAYMEAVMPAQKEMLEKLWIVFGIAAGLMLVWAGICRIRGKVPFFGTYAVCSVFYALHLVYRYQIWCAEPQLIHYVFDFFAALFLMLSCYQLAALCVGRGDSRQQRALALLALLSCVGTLVVTRDPMIYVGSTVLAASCRADPAAPGKSEEGCRDASA